MNNPTKPAAPFKPQLNSEQIIKELTGRDLNLTARDKAFSELKSAKRPIVSLTAIATIFVPLALLAFANFDAKESLQNQLIGVGLYVLAFVTSVAMLAAKESWRQRRRIDALVALLRSNKLI